MKFKIGDKVRFLNEKGEGTVSKIINKTTLGITIEDDFVIPFTISELVLIPDETAEPPVNRNTFIKSPPIETKPVIAKKEKLQTKREKAGIYVAFSPENPNDIAHSDFNVWLVNTTENHALFTYSVFQNGNYITLETGTASGGEFALLETINRKKLHDCSTFKIDVLFFNQNAHSPHPPVSEIIKLKPIKLYKENAFVFNSFISEKALLMTVCHTDAAHEHETFETKADLSKIFFQKQTYVERSKKSKPHISNDPAYEMEVDLHIEELIDNFKGMSNAEIIQVQLKHFQRSLDTAVNEHYRKLIVIHGVGNGRLKQEVRNMLSSYRNLQYYDASYSKYGFGATEILIH